MMSYKCFDLSVRKQLFPMRLPILDHEKEIVDAIDSQRVVVVCGITGCGKSTQIPQFIARKWPDSNIAICQPRRLASTSLARRVSQELKCTLGERVGYQIGMESRMSSQTRILFMTYGILIQNMLYKKDLPYTHIILDQVHERSIEMDFAFIALKKMLDEPLSRSKTKIIIMSATINSNQFSNHFSTHSNLPHRPFLRPILNFSQLQKTFWTRNDKEHITHELKVTLTYKDKHLYKPAQCIALPDVKMYNVAIHYMDDIDKNAIPRYGLNEEIKLKDNVYLAAAKVILNHIKRKKGDILIFVPGMQEIKRMKSTLFQNGFGLADDHIIEVHSAYDDVHEKLFNNEVSPKVIISTNIGESSITLPECTAVVDFCLSRKSIVKTQFGGFSRFETRVSSKSSLLQRKGRVGRTCDGEVWRMIGRKFYDDLEEFDMPEIKCTKLEMVILNAKRIDKTYGSQIFEDPYEVFFNAIDPPSIEQIQYSIDYLISENALIDHQEGQPDKTSKYIGSELELTPIGEFYVSMPFDMKESRLLLAGLQYDVSSVIIDIVGIVSNSRSMFVHDERRDKNENFHHTLAGYDEGRLNDYLIKQGIFAHWRHKFFLPYFNHNKHRLVKMRRSALQESHGFQYSQEKAYTSDQFVGEFCEMRYSEYEKDWCQARGIFPLNLRAILRCTENIRERLRQFGFKIQRRGSQKRNADLINICLTSVYGNFGCQYSSGQAVNLDGPSSRGMKKVHKYYQPEQMENKLRIPNKKNWTNEKAIRDYLLPISNFKMTEGDEGYFDVEGSNEALAKLLHPSMISHRNKDKDFTRNCSEFYKLITSSRHVNYTYNPPILSAEMSSHPQLVTLISSESINKSGVKPISATKEAYTLVGDQYFMTKNQKYHIGGGCLINRKFYYLIRLISQRNIYLRKHISKEYYDAARFNERIYKELPFLLTDEVLELVQQIRRQYIEHTHQITFFQNPKIKKTLLRKLIEVKERLRNQYPEDKWTPIFNRKKYGLTKFDEVRACDFKDYFVHIDKAELMGPPRHFEDYKNWKISMIAEACNPIAKFCSSKVEIICSQCYPNELHKLYLFEYLQIPSINFVVPQYIGYWIEKNDKFYCLRGHYIARKTGPSKGQLERSKVKVLYPFNQVEDYPSGSRYNIILEKLDEGMKEQIDNRNKVKVFDCKICGDEPIKVEKFNRKCKFWQQIQRHVYGEDHKLAQHQFAKNLVETDYLD